MSNIYSTTNLSQAEIDFNKWLEDNHEWLQKNLPEMERALLSTKFTPSSPHYTFTAHRTQFDYIRFTLSNCPNSIPNKN